MFLKSLLTLASALSLSSAAAISERSLAFNLVVDTAPDYARPFVLPHLKGLAVQLIDDIIRIPITNASTGGAFTLLQLNGQNNYAIPTHYHARYHETFFCTKGRMNLWADNETRVLSPGDFGNMPTFQNHSFLFVEPDTEFLAFISPGGFDPFYLNISTPYNSAALAPFPPDRPLHFDQATYIAATGPRLDNFPVNYAISWNLTNGTNNAQIPWHNGNNTLPGKVAPYYIANNWGPKYLQKSLGQVIAPVATSAETGGNFTVATIAMRNKLANETIATLTSTTPQIIRILEGQLTINMAGQTVQMNMGDVAFIPKGEQFQYWSTVAFTKFFHGAAGKDVGLAAELIKQSEPWRYAVFPSYIS